MMALPWWTVVPQASNACLHPFYFMNAISPPPCTTHAPRLACALVSRGGPEFANQ